MNDQDAHVKYAKLRAAALEMIGIEDDKGLLLALAQQMNTMGAGTDEDGAAALKLIVALIETGD